MPVLCRCCAGAVPVLYWCGSRPAWSLYGGALGPSLTPFLCCTGAAAGPLGPCMVVPLAPASHHSITVMRLHTGYKTASLLIKLKEHGYYQGEQYVPPTAPPTVSPTTAPPTVSPTTAPPTVSPNEAEGARLSLQLLGITADIAVTWGSETFSSGTSRRMTSGLRPATPASLSGRPYSWLGLDFVTLFPRRSHAWCDQQCA